MAAPTLAAVRAVAVAWWRGPRPRRLDDLRARIAALWTDPRATVRVSIDNVPPLTLTITFELYDALGNVTNTVVRSATKADLDNTQPDDFDAVVDDSATTLLDRTQASAQVAP
jgi:hypothetical protein